MSYIKTLENGEIPTKSAKKRKLTSYDRFMAKRRPTPTPYDKKLTFTTPKKLFDARKILEEVKQKHGVFFSLENLSSVDHQRFLDYLGGGLFVMNATLKNISEEKYLVLPKDVQIFSDLNLENHN